MANTNTQKPKTVSSFKQSTGLRRFGKTRRFFIVLLCLIVAVIGSVIIYDFMNKRAVEEDKRRFAQADADVTKVVADIVAATGAPYKQEITRRCTLPGVKYEAKRISCGIDGDMFYNIRTYNEASDVLRIVSTELAKTWVINDKSHSNNLSGSNGFTGYEQSNYTARRDYQQIFEVYTDPLAKMTCRATYLYYKGTAPPYNDYPVVADGDVLNISISCNDDAKLAHFPIEE